MNVGSSEITAAPALRRLQIASRGVAKLIEILLAHDELETLRGLSERLQPLARRHDQRQDQAKATV